jgi:hypothetical protein
VRNRSYLCPASRAEWISYCVFFLKQLFGFSPNSYYRDVLVLFAFIAGFGVGVVTVVWIWVRETR